MVVTYIVLSSLSFAASVFVLLIYLAYPSLRSFSSRLVLCLSLSSGLASLANFMGNSETEAMCQTQAFVSSVGDGGAIIFSVAIAFTLHQAFLKANPRFGSDMVDALLTRYMVVCWGAALLFATIPFFNHAYGDTGAWCWIKDDSPSNTALRYVCFYAWLWVAWGYSVYVYVSIIRKIMAVSSGDSEVAISRRQAVRHMVYYPLAMIVCWAPASVNRLYQAFSGDHSYGLALAHVMFSASFGLVNAVVYGFTPAYRSHITASLRNCCGSSPLTTAKPQISHNTERESMQMAACANPALELESQ